MRQRVIDMVATVVETAGYKLVDVVVTQGKVASVQLFVEKDCTKSVNLQDCVKISRIVSPILDVSDVFAGSYNLEVSSVGVNRPLKEREDFEKYLNSKIVIKSTNSIDKYGNRKHFSGIITDVAALSVFIQEERGEVVEIPFSLIKQARLDIL